MEQNVPYTFKPLYKAHGERTWFYKAQFCEANLGNRGSCRFRYVLKNFLNKYMKCIEQDFRAWIGTVPYRTVP